MKNLLKTLSLTTPIMLGYIPLGMTFGFLMTTQGIDWYFAPLFSLFAFAGAIQFLAIPMLINHVSYADIAIATLLVNFRHVFYGMSVLHLLPKKMMSKLYFIFCITDENYSLLTSASGVNNKNALLIVFVNHVYWIVGALIGATLASQLPPVEGLDFALTALFCILFIEQFKRLRSLKLLLIAFISVVVGLAFFPQNFLVAASLLALIILYCDYRLFFSRKEVTK